jgi:repressor LexA
MIGAGIHEGDLVIVRCQPTAEPGDIVVALFEAEATVKRMAIDSGRPCLRAENPAYAPLRGEFELLGKVVGLLRRYPVGSPA